MEGCRATGLGKWLESHAPLLIIATVAMGFNYGIQLCRLAMWISYVD